MADNASPEVRTHSPTVPFLACTGDGLRFPSSRLSSRGGRQPTIHWISLQLHTLLTGLLYLEFVDSNHGLTEGHSCQSLSSHFLPSRFTVGPGYYSKMSRLLGCYTGKQLSRCPYTISFAHPIRSLLRCVSERLKVSSVS